MCSSGCYLVPAHGAAPLSVADMRKYLLGAGLAIQKVPERVEVVTELPMTATGNPEEPAAQGHRRQARGNVR